MGGWLSHAWWGGEPDAADAVSGLSLRDVHLIQRSWAPVYAAAEANGTELLKRLFRAYPSTKTYFRMLDGVAEAEFSAHAQFRAHVHSLMGALQLAVLRLREPDVVAAMMKKLGASHRARGITEADFNDLKVVIVGLFTEVLQLDARTMEAWARALGFWYKHIFSSLNAPRDS